MWRPLVTAEPTDGPFVGDGVHAERQLLLRVFVELFALGEGLGNHAALLDPLGLVVAAANHPALENKMEDMFRIAQVLEIFQTQFVCCSVVENANQNSRYKLPL